MAEEIYTEHAIFLALENERLEYLSDATTALNESLDIPSMVNSFVKVVTKDMYRVCLLDLYDPETNSVDRSISVRGVPEIRRSKFAIPKNISKDIRIFDGASREVVLEMLRDEALADYIKKEEINSFTVVPLVSQDNCFGHLTLITKRQDRLRHTLDFSFVQDLGKRTSLAFENARLYMEAREASKAKSSFLANISHEVRNPLGAMLGFGELLLEDDNLSKEQKYYVSTIVKNANQLLRIVDEVLDLSKAESDKIVLERIDFSLFSLIEDVMSLLQVKAQEKGLNLVSELSPNLPNVINSDPFRIRQILLNIIGNAIKFTMKGEVKLKVSFDQVDGSNEGVLHFLIQDTGIGMAPDQVSRIFKPFLQAENSTSRKFGGTGLGLFFAKKLASLLNGDIILEDTSPNQGSRFRITVHVLLSDQANPAEEISDIKFTEPYELYLQDGSQRRVLIVDDSFDSQVLIKTLLSKVPLKIDMADNGIMGVQSALAEPYDLILMDIQMPEMDGFQAIKELRKSGYIGSVVALTARAMKGDRELCLGSGFDDYLCKPISRLSLYKCLSRNLH